MDSVRVIENKAMKNCPFCGKHIFFAKSKEASQTISVCDADNPDAEALFQCPKCGKEIGFIYRRSAYTGTRR